MMNKWLMIVLCFLLVCVAILGTALFMSSRQQPQASTEVSKSPPPTPPQSKPGVNIEKIEVVISQTSSTSSGLPVAVNTIGANDIKNALHVYFRNIGNDFVNINGSFNVYSVSEIEKFVTDNIMSGQAAEAANKFAPLLKREFSGIAVLQVCENWNNQQSHYILIVVSGEKGATILAVAPTTGRFEILTKPNYHPVRIEAK